MSPSRHSPAQPTRPTPPSWPARRSAHPSTPATRVARPPRPAQSQVAVVRLASPSRMMVATSRWANLALSVWTAGPCGDRLLLLVLPVAAARPLLLPALPALQAPLPRQRPVLRDHRLQRQQKRPPRQDRLLAARLVSPRPAPLLPALLEAAAPRLETRAAAAPT